MRVKLVLREEVCVREGEGGKWDGVGKEGVGERNAVRVGEEVGVGQEVGVGEEVGAATFATAATETSRSYRPPCSRAKGYPPCIHARPGWSSR